MLVERRPVCRIEGVVVAHIYPYIGILTHDLSALPESAVEYFRRSGRKSDRRLSAHARIYPLADLAAHNILL
jgi:hypothetical protein